MQKQKLSWDDLNSYGRETIEGLLRTGYRQLYYKVESRPSRASRKELLQEVMNTLVEKKINVSLEALYRYLEVRSLDYDDMFQRQLELEQC